MLWRTACCTRFWETTPTFNRSRRRQPLGSLMARPSSRDRAPSPWPPLSPPPEWRGVPRHSRAKSLPGRRRTLAPCGRAAPPRAKTSVEKMDAITPPIAGGGCGVLGPLRANTADPRRRNEGARGAAPPLGRARARPCGSRRGRRWRPPRPASRRRFGLALEDARFFARRSRPLPPPHSPRSRYECTHRRRRPRGVAASAASKGAVAPRRTRRRAARRRRRAAMVTPGARIRAQRELIQRRARDGTRGPQARGERWAAAARARFARRRAARHQGGARPSEECSATCGGLARARAPVHATRPRPPPSRL